MTPPTVLPRTEAQENIEAPNSAGIYPPIVEPTITPIIINVLVGIGGKTINLISSAYYKMGAVDNWGLRRYTIVTFSGIGESPNRW